MMGAMAQPKLSLPDALKPLVDGLAALPPEDRERVIVAARDAAGRKARVRRVPWEHLRRARGIVRLGGDAVEDCNALYDG